MPCGLDPEIARATAVGAFYLMERLISQLPASEPLPAGEVAAMLRLILAARELDACAANDG